MPEVVSTADCANDLAVVAAKIWARKNGRETRGGEFTTAVSTGCRYDRLAARAELTRPAARCDVDPLTTGAQDFFQLVALQC